MSLETIFVRILALPLILPSIILHEYAHGKMAQLLGDPTASTQGRLSLNPLVHIDWVGLMMLVFFGIGWAKPVPINPGYFKNYKKGLALVGLAGPLSNLTIAWALSAVFFKILQMRTGFLAEVIAIAVQLNLVLMVFNLIPLPPLDGSRILMGLLPDDFMPFFMQLEQMGFMIILLLVFFIPGFQSLIFYAVNFLFRLMV
jgi:Zn-dependent protease